MHKDINELLLNEADIAEIVKSIAFRISEDYKGKNLLLVCVLKGSICFMADLMREISVPLKIEFLRAKSYLSASTESAGEVEVRSEIDNLREYDVLVVEDIFDTGRTLQRVTEKMISDGAKSVECCTLLDKPERRDSSVTLKPKYIGRVIPNAFVVGYGLDYNECYRDLPYVGILKPEVYGG